MSRILGYTDRISASPGESIQVKVSCDGVQQYDADLVRVIHGDINPSGPGYREEVIELDLGGPFDGRFQPINAGSYAVIDSAPPCNTQTSFGMQALIWPTLPGSGPQTILSQENQESRTGFRLFIDAEGVVGFEIEINGIKNAQVSTGATLIAQRWYLLSADYDADNGCKD